MENTQRLSARDAFEQLPGKLRIPRGAGFRINARFHNGQLSQPPKLTCFRIPPSLALSVRLQLRQPLNHQLLEYLAAELALDHGETELVLEYSDTGGGIDSPPRLRWLDYSWTDSQPAE